MKDPGERLLAADFFVFRTPLLPFDEFVRWGEGLQAPQADPTTLENALAADRDSLRAILRRVIDQPVVREAIWVASPSLAESIAHWLSSPDSERGGKVEVSLSKYFARMSGRATPLGLFSGVSTGRIGAATCLQLTAQQDYRRRTRLDFQFLGALAFALSHDAQFRLDVGVRPNSSLHKVGNSLRFVALPSQDGQREPQFIVADSSPFIDELLAWAAASPSTPAPAARQTPRTLAAMLAARHPEITLEEASGLLAQLLDIHLLVSELEPAVTGAGALDDMLAQLRRHPDGAGVCERLSAAHLALAELDARGLCSGAPARYRAIVEQLEDLPAPLEAGRLFQVDLFKPAPSAALGKPILDEITRGVSLLRRLCESADPLQHFRALFQSRYEENPEDVPLQELLDQELGLFGLGSAGNSEGQLLSELGLRAAQEPTKRAWTPQDEHRLRLLSSALSSGAAQIALTEADIGKLEVANSPPFVDSLSVHAVLSAATPQSIEQGDYSFHILGTDGPPGARLLSRFCYGDAELESGVRRLLAAEEALHPDALFAEIVHLPATERFGNFMQRPVLRHYEIPYLGRSGASLACQIPASDLLVSVKGRRVVLRSRTHGKEVVPRLTNAHNYSMDDNDRLYRFLCDVANQDTAGGWRWHWGDLRSAPFLPRVVYGRLVLSLATWNLNKEELTPLCRLHDAPLYRAVQALRARRGLPRFVLFASSLATDNWLPVDLDNLLSIEAWVQLLGSLERAVLTELFPAPTQMIATGPEGRFVHELVVPLSLARSPATIAEPDIRRQPARAQREFSEGSEWLYAKLYVSSTAVDDLLLDLGKSVSRLLRAGAMDRFFFIRYADPFWHLRFRVHGEPARLRQEVLPALSAAGRRFMAQGLGWRFQLDTYRRETERYGGDEAIELCERIFCADSAAVLAILQAQSGDEPPDIRWQLALPGMDRLLDDLTLSLDERLQTLEAVAAAFRREFSGTANLERGLSKKQRQLGKSVEAYLRADDAQAGPLQPFMRHLQARSQAIRPYGIALRELATSRRLCRSLTELAGSLLHMHVNRLLRAHHRQHEVVLYDLLLRHYRSRRAQAK